jgi:hypothetical protein
MSERTVNTRQLQVLTWIVQGCPEGVMSGTSHKATAVALQSRRLAIVSRRGGVWKAVATEAGRYFIEHGQYPAGHWFTEPAPSTRPSPVVRRAAPRPVNKVTGHRPVDQMIADLIEAGGELTVETLAPGYWEGLASSATRHKKVPEGKLLQVVRGATWGERVIRLEDPPEWMSATLQPVPVAEQLRAPHPSVKALRDNSGRLRMKQPTRTRALRVLDALAKACLQRGYVVATPRPTMGYAHATGCIEITINGHHNVIDVDELNDRVPHEPTVKELRDKERSSWVRIPSHDQVPSGRLRIKLLSGSAVRQDSFADTKTMRLEERLPVVLQELELRAAAAEERAQQLERERQERQWRWEEVRDGAIIEARQRHRAKILTRQAEQWHEASRMDAYLKAMAERIKTLTGAEKSAAEEWLAWCSGYRAQLDPLHQPLAMPADPDFTGDVLAPFMQGMSPYAPSAW